jgi:hypothetical protein
MIKGMHAMFYSSAADALREFIRDVVRMELYQPHYCRQSERDS